MEEKEERKWKVYCHENKINSKRYVGITGQELNQRWRNGQGYIDGYSKLTYFGKAIKKYGWDEGFYHYVIEDNLTEKEAKDIEIKLIKDWDLNNILKGYNITKGGDGVTGYRHTKETKRKISEIQIGKKRSPQAILRFSASMKGKMPKNIQLLLDSNNEKQVELLSFNNEGELVNTYKSINETARMLNIYATNIVKCLKGFHKTCGGYWFISQELYDEKIHTKNFIMDKFKNAPLKNCGVIATKIETNESFKFSTLNECERDLNIDRHRIGDCCLNKRDSYGGYTFKYA